MPENRNFSPGDLSAEKINRRPNFGTQKSHLFSVEECAAAKRVSISFVTVQDFPHRFAQNAINFDSDKTRLFDDSRITVLEEEKASQHTVSVKPKISQDKEPKFRQAAPAQRTVDGQKGGGRERRVGVLACRRVGAGRNVSAFANNWGITCSFDDKFRHWTFTRNAILHADTPKRQYTDTFLLARRHAQTPIHRYVSPGAPTRPNANTPIRFSRHADTPKRQHPDTFLPARHYADTFLPLRRSADTPIRRYVSPGAFLPAC
jgi:hypothetical protein